MIITGARYQITIDGRPRTNRDDKAIAIKSAEYLKHKNPHTEIAVHDRVTGDTITIKVPIRAPWHTRSAAPARTITT
jgi:hypothetical protein